MTVVEILELDDEFVRTGIHMTLEQKAPLLLDLWEAMTLDEKKAISDRLPNVA